MCGIAAIYAYRTEAPPVDRDEILRVRDAMRRRGPDGEGLWLSDDSRVGLAHRRLSIIDTTSGGAQPMATPDGCLRITFNGEIYNYVALRRELEAQGDRFASQSDTEVLLHLYERYGADMVAKLRGMYAFALWDERRRELFLARDPLGIKPLYVADNGKTVRVASQVKALAAGGQIDTRPSAAGHAGFWLLGSVPEPFTIHRGVRALAPGTTCVYRSDGPTTRVHSSVTEVLASAEAGGRADRRSGALAEALGDSVASHLVADVPVGVFLSAGLDSSCIAALAAEAQASPLRTLTLAFEEFRGELRDEAPLAAATAEALGADHRTRGIRRDEFEADAARVTEAMDQPTIDGVNTYFVSKVAAEAGLKVALSGIGGDELFAGYPAFREIPRLVAALGPFACVPVLGRAARRASAPVVARLTSPKYAGLFEYGSSYAGAYLLRRALFMPWELPEVIDPDLAREGWRELALVEALERTIAGIHSPRLRVTALETAWYMRNQLLRDADWAGMAHSVEIRVPLVDWKLLTTIAPLLAGAAPPGKRDMAAAPKRRLPPAVLDRPKTGFMVPVHEWLAGAAGGRAERGQPERGLRGWARHVYAAFA
jgi:asparagine synthase (glutamine-hydrolysing)